MATEKKYLDLQGLQHLKEQKVLVKHPSDPAASAAAVKVGRDENGHVVLVEVNFSRISEYTVTVRGEYRRIPSM